MRVQFREHRNRGPSHANHRYWRWCNWFCRFIRRLNWSSDSIQEGVEMSALDAARFAWLADAPLYIDSTQIERFYDAVLRPTYVEGATSVTFGSAGEITVGGELSGSGKLT